MYSIWTVVMKYSKLQMNEIINQLHCTEGITEVVTLVRICGRVR